MRRLAIVAMVFVLTAQVARSQDSDEARKLAEKLTTEGAATFVTKNAPAMAGFYAENAQLMMISKEKGTNEVKVETRKGRAEIEGFYRHLFEHAKVLTEHPTNTVIISSDRFAANRDR